MTDESITTKWQEYIEHINKEVRSSDDLEIGNVEAVNEDIFVVKRGFIKIHYYYIPVAKVKLRDYDSSVLRLKIKENEVKDNYERNKSPDPYRYYVKDYPYYTAGYFPPLAITKNKWLLSKYRNRTTSLQHFVAVFTASKKSTIQICDLCDTKFNSSKELSEHIKSYHS